MAETEGGNSERVPSFAALQAEFRRLRAAIDGIALKPFFEPVSVLDLSNSKSRLLNLRAAMLKSWAAHVAYSTIVRMRLLEDALLEHLTARHSLPAAVLSRAHMEAASLPAYSLDRLRTCAKSGTWAKMTTIVPEVLFGTSLKLAPRGNIWEDVFDFSDTEPVHIKDAIDSMDGFVECASLPTRRYFRAAYALLSEFAHPNLAATRDLINVVEESAEGWLLHYKYTESATEKDISNLLQVVLQSARVGYASAVLLLNGRFQDRPEGPDYGGPDPGAAEWVWANILSPSNR